MKLGKDTGSVFNSMMSNSVTPPKVGEGATILHWTDRSAYFVNSVSEDGKSVVIERTNPVRIDNNGMSESQQYKFERDSDAKPETIRFRYGKWRYEYVDDETGKKTYGSPVKIIFGVMREYYDYSF